MKQPLRLALVALALSGGACAGSAIATKLGEETLPQTRSAIVGLQASYEATCEPFPSDDAGKESFCRTAFEVLKKSHEVFNIVNNAAKATQ